MTTIIAVTNQKGGVGKTTTSGALAAGFSAQGKRVLGIDLDPQGNLGFSLGLNMDQAHTIYEVLKREVSIEEAIEHTDVCDLIGSDIMLSTIELEVQSSGREMILKEILSPMARKYDYIIIDTPPALNILTVNAYAVADYLIIPMSPEILSLVGVSQIKETIETVRSTYNPHLNVLGILLTKFNRRTLLAQEVAEMAENIAAQLGTVVFENKIRTSVCVAEAPAHGESILEYAPRSTSASDYRGLLEEIQMLLKQQQRR